jgi:hypothetical protein
MNSDIKSDFPADVSMARFRSALGSAMKVSKEDLNRLLAQDKFTPLVPQKRGPKPKSAVSARASGDTD